MVATDLGERLKSSKELIALAAETWFATEAEILSPSRASNLVAARRWVARALRESGWSYPMIGRALHRDHTDIMHLVKNEGYVKL